VGFDALNSQIDRCRRELITEREALEALKVGQHKRGGPGTRDRIDTTADDIAEQERIVARKEKECADLQRQWDEMRGR